MAVYLLKRIVAILVSLFILATVTFFLMRSIPGGPFATDRKITAAAEQALEERYGLDGSLASQYFRYMQGLLRLNLGESIKYRNKSVNTLIAEGFPASAKLGVLAVCIVVFLGVPLGVLSALKKGTMTDKTIVAVSTIGISVPSFVIATLLLYFLGFRLRWFPIYGVATWKGYILPGIALGSMSLASIVRFTRTSMLEVLSRDYIVVARAKGVRPWKIYFVDALKNALIPVITVLGPMIASLVTGTFVIEKIFAIPGMGEHFVTSITGRDYTVIMGITLFYAVFLCVAVLLMDMVYALLNPKMRSELTRRR